MPVELGALLSFLAFAAGAGGAPPSLSPVIAGDAAERQAASDTIPHRLPGVVVRSTRGERRIEDDPIRVDVISREEVEEKLLMTPGSVAMLLAETAGVRVQDGSPALGGASVRLQGLPGRYTRLLVDGLPLYPGPTGSLGLLQIPPMDLEQVEIVKGVASALYGPAAMGGVVNLISREPDGERELLLNFTSAGGRDLLGWWSVGEDGSGATLLAGVHQQDWRDRSGDGWANHPRYERVTVRPRLFGTFQAGGQWMVTAGATTEERLGGGRGGLGAPSPVGVDTRRGDAGGSLHLPLGTNVLGVRGSVSGVRHRHAFPSSMEEDRHSSLYLEATLGGFAGRQHWMVGAVYEEDRLKAEFVPGLEYRYRTPALFAQNEAALSANVTAQGSLRLDGHSEYGALWSPRGALRVDLPGEARLRFALGSGGFAATPLLDVVDEVGLSRVHLPAPLELERATSGSVDLSGSWGEAEGGITLFASVVNNPLAAWEEGPPGGGRLTVANLDTPLESRGVELLVRYHAEPLAITAFHTFLSVREGDPQRLGAPSGPSPMVPRHQTGVVAFLEEHDLGRIGVEAYRTSSHPLEANPYRNEAPTTLIVGVLGEWKVGPARLFLNLENLTNVRQDRFDPMLYALPSAAGRQTVDAWTSLEGRVVNGGVRWSF